MSALVGRLRAIPSWQVTLGLALLALGFLVAAQLQSEGPRIRYTTQERPPLVETALDLTRRQDQLKARIIELSDRIRELENSAAQDDELVASLDRQLTEVRTAAGLVALVGPGVVLQIEDASGPIPPDAAPGDYRVSAADLRDLVSELWLAGAEAIAVNGERITPTTAAIDIGSSILVNSAYLAPPYQASAIGPDDLYDRLTASPGFVRLVQDRVDQFGLRLSFAVLEDVVVPAYSGTIRLVDLRAAASNAP